MYFFKIQRGDVLFQKFFLFKLGAYNRAVLRLRLRNLFL